MKNNSSESVNKICDGRCEKTSRRWMIAMKNWAFLAEQVDIIQKSWSEWAVWHIERYRSNNFRLKYNSFLGVFLFITKWVWRGSQYLMQSYKKIMFRNSFFLNNNTKFIFSIKKSNFLSFYNWLCHWLEVIESSN